MVPFQYPARRSEQGAALVISLILLAVMTILVISTMRTSILQLRISGSSETLSINLARSSAPPTNMPLTKTIGKVGQPVHILSALRRRHSAK